MVMRITHLVLGVALLGACNDRSNLDDDAGTGPVGTDAAVGSRDSGSEGRPDGGSMAREDGGTTRPDGGGATADGGSAADAGQMQDAGTRDSGAPSPVDAGPPDAGVFCPGSVTPSVGDLVVNEVHAAPDSDDDVNCDGVFDGQYEEFIEIVNTRSTPLDARGVTLRVNGTDELTLDQCLPPNGALVVYRDTRITSTSCALGASTAAAYAALVLSNSGATVSLVDVSAATLDTVTYPDLGATSPPRTSYVRSPDYTGSFAEHTTADATDGSTHSAGTCIDGSTFPSCAP